MDALAYAKLHPKAFHRKYFQKGVRPDMRQLLQFRDVSVSTGSIETADSSALVRLGDTTVLCGIQLEAKTPDHAKPDIGELEIKVQTWPLCSPTARIGAASDASLQLARSLHRTLSTPGVMDMQQLCISKGRAVWVIRCDVMVLDDSGNLQDAALMSLVAALRTLKIPAHQLSSVSKVPDQGPTAGPAEPEVVELVPGNGEPLNILATPLSCTFAVFENLLVVDPTHEEVSVADGVVTVTRLADQRLCSLYKPGGRGLSQDQIQYCLQQSKSILGGLHAVLERKLIPTATPSGATERDAGQATGAE